MAEICQKCGAGSADGAKQCGNCGGPLGEASAAENDNEGQWQKAQGSARGPVEAWPVVESPGSKKRRKVYSLAVALFAVGAALMVLGFMLAASANERIEGMYSGDLDDMMAVLDDLEEITRTAKWGGYFLTAGQISATIGLLLIAVGLRHSLG